MNNEPADSPQRTEDGKQPDAYAAALAGLRASFATVLLCKSTAPARQPVKPVPAKVKPRQPPAAAAQPPQV